MVQLKKGPFATHLLHMKNQPINMINTISGSEFTPKIHKNIVYLIQIIISTIVNILMVISALINLYSNGYNINLSTCLDI